MVKDFIRPYDKAGLMALVRGKRYIYTLPYTENILSFSNQNNLKIVGTLSKIKKSYHGDVIITVKKKIKDVILIDKILTICPEDYVNDTKKLFNTIKNLDIANAFLYIQKEYTRKHYFAPEIDIINGFLFGFKPCDILYYIQTRDLNFPKHRYERKLMNRVNDYTPTLEEQHVMCESCSIKFLKKLN